MWEDSRYFWVVLCKNHWFHARKNLFFRHKILLGETDAITPRPVIDQRFKVRCDECGKEYTYKASEVLRVEQEPPEGFTPHRLFRDEDTGPDPIAADTVVKETAVVDTNNPPSSIADAATPSPPDQPGDATKLRRAKEA